MASKQPSQVKQLHDEEARRLHSRCIEGRSTMSSIPEDNWYLIFGKKDTDGSDETKPA